MKTLITLFTSTLIFLNSGVAQFSENFDQNITGLQNNCWSIDNINYTTTSGDVINGTGSAYTNPPTNSGGRSIATPYLNVNSTSLNVSFKYKPSSKISGNATRTIEILLVDKNGNSVSLQTLTMDKNTPTTVQTHNNTYTLSTPGVFRLELIIGGSSGDGNSRVIFDDLLISASAYYTNFCNPAAVAVSNSFSSSTISSVSGNVLTNDNLPADNDTYSAYLVTAPTQGTLVMNANGTFTYTPVIGYTGGTVTFTYLVNDNGYAPTSSNTVTVSINYASMAMLPIRLVSFNAGVEKSSVKISWIVDENQSGDYFEVEKSFDGKGFTTLSKIAARELNGMKEYSTEDNASKNDIYYRLKIVSRDQSVSYSKVVLVKSSGVASELRLLNNPAVSSLNFTYNSERETNSTVTLYSIAGVKVYEKKMLATQGMNRANVQLQSFQPGTYVLQLETEGNRSSSKFIIK